MRGRGVVNGRGGLAVVEQPAVAARHVVVVIVVPVPRTAAEALPVRVVVGAVRVVVVIGILGLLVCLSEIENNMP